MEFGAATDPGIVRENNEDNYRVDADLGVFIVADGIGGHVAGEVASFIAVETIQKHLLEHQPSNSHPPEKTIIDSINAAHKAILSAAGGNDNNVRMGTTIVLMWIPSPPEEAWIAHVGDSRAYLLHDEKLQTLTDDHTLFMQAQREGILPENPNLWPPRQALSQALGASDVIEPEISHVDLIAGDKILLCTDGLTDMVPDDEIFGLLRQDGTPQETCEKLVRSAIANGGQDNVTVVLIPISET